MTKKLTGINPLAYVGVNAEKPSNLTMHDRNPTTNDYSNFVLGDLWLYPVVNRVFMLMDKTAGVATWLQLSTSGGGDDVEGLISDDALTSTPDVNGKITLSGGTNITTSQAATSNLKIDLDNNVVLSGNLSAAGTVTMGSFGVGVLQSSAAGVLSSSNGTDGQVLIGGGTAPVWSTITQGAGITIANAANSITITATSAANDLIVGSIVKYDGVFPGGTSWLECDGSAVSQTTYAELFARVGHEYLIPTYTLQTTSFTGTIYCVAHNGLAGADGLWVAAGQNGELETSPDGVTWTIRTSNFGASIIYSVAHNGLTGGSALWTAVGASGKISTSPDGVTWTTRTSNFIGGYHIYDVAHNGVNLWVCCGTGGYYSHSADGITWVNVSAGAGIEDIKSVTYNNGTWVMGDALGGASDLLYSASGTAWSAVYTQNWFRTNNAPGFTDVASSAALFIATSNGTQTNPQTLTSTDGANWKDCGDVLGRRYYPKCIEFGDPWFTMGTADYARIARSKDGVTWENITSPFDNGAYPVTGDTIYGIASNKYASPDTDWVAVSDNHKLALGTPAINTATHFYLPNIPGYVILF